MRRTVREAHRHLTKHHPVMYCAIVLALLCVVVLASLGYLQAALLLFVVAGLAGLALFRYED